MTCPKYRNSQDFFVVFRTLDHRTKLPLVWGSFRLASNSNHHSRVPRWRAFTFPQLPFQCMLGMPSNSAIKAKFQKRASKSIDFWKKNLFTSWIQIRDLLDASQLHYPLDYVCFGFRWNAAWVFSTSLFSTHCRTQADPRINSWWPTWSRRMMD